MLIFLLYSHRKSIFIAGGRTAGSLFLILSKWLSPGTWSIFNQYMLIDSKVLLYSINDSTRIIILNMSEYGRNGLLVLNGKIMGLKAIATIFPSYLCDFG